MVKNSGYPILNDAPGKLMNSIQLTLETYSNVHRGSGHNSIVTTHLYDRARNIVRDYLGLSKENCEIFFFTSRRAAVFISKLKTKDYKIITSRQFGLPLGVTAISVNRKFLPENIPFISGGGTTKLYSKEWVIRADSPDKFEAGTPAIINVIAFAKALLMIKKYGTGIFKNVAIEEFSPDEILNREEFIEFPGRQLLQKLQQTLIGRNTLVPTNKGLRPFINLDNSASTPTFASILNVYKKAFLQPENICRRIINEVKSICADFLTAPQSEYDIIFTSNTTESINLAAESFGLNAGAENEPVILSTILEHSSNDLPWRDVKGSSVIRLSVDKEGFWDLNELESILASYNTKNEFGRKRIKLVAVSGASNVLGSCNNLTETSKVVHKYGAFLFVDAAQLAAHREINMKKCDIDFLALSGHKIYAPFGCGVLAVKKGYLNFNDKEMEIITASGEENAAGIAALGKALLLLKQIGFDVIKEEEQVLTRKALQGLIQIPGIKIFGIQNPDSEKIIDKTGVIGFEIQNMMPGGIAKKLSYNNGVGVRYGCHCAHLIVKHQLNFTPFLENFQKFLLKVVPILKLQGFVRVSFGIENTAEDVETFLIELNKIAKKGKPDSADLKKAEVKKQIDQFTENISARIYATE